MVAERGTVLQVVGTAGGRLAGMVSQGDESVLDTAGIYADVSLFGMEADGNGRAINSWGRLKNLAVGTMRCKSRVVAIRAIGCRIVVIVVNGMTFLNARGHAVEQEIRQH